MATAAKVLRLSPSPSHVKLDDGPATIALCQRAIRSSPLKYSEIAHRAGLGAVTVSNIAYGDTKAPRMSTVVRILMVLGWAVYATDE